MATNPVFPLYYNDFRGSTADWTDEEVGAYIRFLIYQWDKGALPNDSQRLAKIAASFATTWQFVGKKFVETPEGLVNMRLKDIKDKMLEYSKKQSLNARKRSQTGSQTPSQTSAKTMLSSSSSSSSSYSNTGICFEMMRVVKNQYPHYPADEEKDFPALLQIGYKIAKQKKWEPESILNGHMVETVEAFKKIISFTADDDWFSTRSVSDFNKEFQRIVQGMTKRTKQQPTNQDQKSGPTAQHWQAPDD